MFRKKSYIKLSLKNVLNLTSKMFYKKDLHEDLKRLLNNLAYAQNTSWSEDGSDQAVMYGSGKLLSDPVEISYKVKNEDDDRIYNSIFVQILTIRKQHNRKTSIITPLLINKKSAKYYISQFKKGDYLSFRGELHSDLVTSGDEIKNHFNFWVEPTWLEGSLSVTYRKMLQKIAHQEISDNERNAKKQNVEAVKDIFSQATKDSDKISTQSHDQNRTKKNREIINAEDIQF